MESTQGIQQKLLNRLTIKILKIDGNKQVFVNHKHLVIGAIHGKTVNGNFVVTGVDRVLNNFMQPKDITVYEQLLQSVATNYDEIGCIISPADYKNKGVLYTIK
ncbi:MAG: hypothetical protein JWP81_1180 [Ferruginibacter sp.]|nr:hypothetical protein [Ferruginibacter sp.]